MKHINEYLEYLEIEKGRSKKTIDNYGRYLGRFLKFSRSSEPKHIADEVVRKYRLWLNRENLDRHTQNYHLIALRGFLKYLVKRGVQTLAPEAIELARTTERYIDMVDADDLDRLLKAPADGNALPNFRDCALLELLFSSGLRVSELCSLDRDTVNPQKTEFSIRGKGGKIRVVFVSENTRAALKQYLNKRGRYSLGSATAGSCECGYHAGVYPHNRPPASGSAHCVSRRAKEKISYPHSIYKCNLG